MYNKIFDIHINIWFNSIKNNFNAIFNMTIKTKIKNKVSELTYKYSHFFDTKLENSTITVWIIGMFIFSVWISFWEPSSMSANNSLKANLFEINKQENIVLPSEIINNKEWTLVIGGKTYRVTISEEWDRWNFCSY